MQWLAINNYYTLSVIETGLPESMEADLESFVADKQLPRSRIKTARANNYKSIIQKKVNKNRNYAIDECILSNRFSLYFVYLDGKRSRPGDVRLFLAIQ